MIRDKLVWGIENTKIQQVLLAEDKLTYAKAHELAQALEAAAQDAKELSAGTPVAVHKVQGPASPTTRSNGKGQGRRTTGASSQPPSPCYRCRGKHWAARC